MEHINMIDMLGRAFAKGEIDELRPYMADNCDYASDYSGKSFCGVETILSNMKAVHANVDETCAYTYEVVALESVLLDGMTLADLDNQDGMHPC